MPKAISERPDENLLAQLDPILDRIRAGAPLVVVTGAGVSADSGVPLLSQPTARGSFFDDQELRFLSRDGFLSDPFAAWAFYDRARSFIAKCEPNKAHLALVEIEKKVQNFVLATHNVDGLHQKAGSARVHELSGSLWELHCTSCKTIVSDRTPKLTEIPPRCTCGSILRPNVVLFGEVLKAEPYSILKNTLRRDKGIFLLTGLSGLNQTVTDLVTDATLIGWCIVEINPAETPISSKSLYRLRLGASAAISRVAESLF